MLAGLLELLPWLKQWHNEPSAEYDGQRLGDYFEQYLDGECALHGLSREGLRAWRPVSQDRAQKALSVPTLRGRCVTRPGRGRYRAETTRCHATA
jgi:Domain of unknown function (DUF7008)